jgi:hypothetical protein
VTYFTALAGWTRFQGPSPISRLRRIGEPSELHSGVGSCWSLASGRGEGARLSVRFGGAVPILSFEKCRASTTVCTCLQREDFDTFN